MNEKSVKKCSKYLIGYAYQVFSYSIETYLVIKKENIEVIPYGWYDYSSLEKREEIIEKIKEEGYKPIDDFIGEKDFKQLLKKRG